MGTVKIGLVTWLARWRERGEREDRLPMSRGTSHNAARVSTCRYISRDLAGQVESVYG